MNFARKSAEEDLAALVKREMDLTGDDESTATARVLDGVEGREAYRKIAEHTPLVSAATPVKEPGEIERIVKSQDSEQAALERRARAWCETNGIPFASVEDAVAAALSGDDDEAREIQRLNDSAIRKEHQALRFWSSLAVGGCLSFLDIGIVGTPAVTTSHESRRARHRFAR